MVPDLENMVGVVVHPIQAVKAFDELQNLYEVSRYRGGTLYLFYWTILAFSVLVNHSICPVDGSAFPNWSWYWLTKGSKNTIPWNPTRQRASPCLEEYRLSKWLEPSHLFIPWFVAFHIIVDNPFLVPRDYSLKKNGLFSWRFRSKSLGEKRNDFPMTTHVLIDCEFSRQHIFE